MNLLEQLKNMTKVVADTGDIESIKKFKPVDATTNPSLIYAAAQDERYQSIIDGAIKHALEKTNDQDAAIHLALDKLIVDFGVEILKIVPGRVSTEVDARLSFDEDATIEKARELIALYEMEGISKDKILIKIASTWEGICAAEILTKEGINCNLTLLFSIPQAIACAEAKVQLISPFVGRILDWHKKDRGVDFIPPEEEPGVQLVTNIYHYFKKFGYQTEVMGASFRNTGEIIELAGCDLLTISPSLLQELESGSGNLERKLQPDDHKKLDIEKIPMDEKKFRWMLNEDAMATEKLAEGIRRFTEDIIKLEKMLIKMIKESSISV